MYTAQSLGTQRDHLETSPLPGARVARRAFPPGDTIVLSACRGGTGFVECGPEEAMPQKTSPDTPRDALKTLGRCCRTVAALLVSGLWPGWRFSDVESRLEALPMRQQTVIVGGTLALLAALAFVAAQAGIVGLLVYLLVVIVIAR